jgi:hypothetical protein
LWMTILIRHMRNSRNRTMKIQKIFGNKNRMPRITSTLTLKMRRSSWLRSAVIKEESLAKNRRMHLGWKVCVRHQNNHKSWYSQSAWHRIFWILVILTIHLPRGLCLTLSHKVFNLQSNWRSMMGPRIPLYT